jgi:TRAP-type C4-dicarboxylate transport system permease large subunit
MMIGLVTPPMGELVFLIAGVSGIPVAAITKELWIFLAVLIALLFVLIYVTEITLWLPNGLRAGSSTEIRRRLRAIPGADSWALRG